MDKSASVGRFLDYFSALIRFSPSRFFAGCFLNVVSAVLSGAGLLMLIPLLHYTGWLPTHYEGGWMGSVLRHLPFQQGKIPLIAALTIFILLVASVAWIEYWRQSLTARLRLSFLFDLRQKLNSGIARARWSYILSRKLQHAQHMVTVGQSQVAALTQYCLQMVSDGILLVVYLSFSLVVSFQLTLLTGIAAMALFFVYGKNKALLSGTQYFGANRRLQERLGHFLDGIKIAKGYDRVDPYVLHFDDLLKEEQDHQFTFLRDQNLARVFVTLASAILFCVSFFIAVRFLHLQIATLIVILVLFSRLMPRVSSLLQTYLKVVNLTPVYGEMQTMLDEYKAYEEPAGSGIPPPLLKAIRFENVHYIHSGGVIGLQGVSYSIPAFKTTVIFGPSGAGKTTLADVLLGLLIPQSGAVYIDDVLLDGVTSRAWRSSIGYVPQEAYLFNDTIRANLLWADPSADEARIWEALETAAADVFVRRLPSGLDTPIGDRGGHLSGGERQRLALARALIRQPKILLLDEATNALDAQNEEFIYNALKRLHGKISIIIITHRRSTLQLVDHVLELADGKLVGSCAI